MPIKTLGDIVTNVQSTLYERVSDPLLRSFTTFFLGFNWKPIAILVFGESPVSERIKDVAQSYWFPLAPVPKVGIEGVLLIQWFDFFYSLSRTFLLPFLASLAWVWFWPKIQRFFVVYSEKQKTQTINAKKKEEGKRLLDVDEARHLRSQIKELQDLVGSPDTALNRENVRNTLKDGLVKSYGNQREDYIIARAEARAYDRISPGFFVALSKESNYLTFSVNQAEVIDFVLILSELGGRYFATQKAGKVTVEQQKALGMSEFSAENFYMYNVNHNPIAFSSQEKLPIADAWRVLFFVSEDRTLTLASEAAQIEGKNARTTPGESKKLREALSLE